MFDIAFFTIFLTTLALFVWCGTRLRRRHPQLFESSGLAKMMKTESMGNVFVWTGFLYGPTWKSLDDPLLNWGMRILQILFPVSYGLLIVSLASGFSRIALHN